VHRFGEVILSRSNPLVKRMRSLHRSHGRDEERAFLVEGRRAVLDIIAAGVVPEMVLVRDGDEALVSGARLPVGCPVRRVTAEVFASVSGTVHGQGIVASVPMPTLEISPTQTPLVLVIDGVRDPGNMGTLLRSAAAAGVSAIFVGDETVDPYSPKVVRAAMGAHFRVPLRVGGGLALEALQPCNLRVLADASGEVSYDAVDWTRPALLVIGGEAKGASEPTRQFVDIRVSIPMASGVESLNAGVAGGVILFEAARQRRVTIDREPGGSGPDLGPPRTIARGWSEG